MKMMPSPIPQNTVAESPIRFKFQIAQTKLQVINVRESGHWHLGLDLQLSEYLGSQSVGDLIEEYLLAYLAGAELSAYRVKSNLSTFNISDLAAGITSFQTDLRVITQSLESKEIQVVLENSQIKISFQIPLSFESLYGNLDKKDLEEAFWRQLQTPELSLPEVVYPSLEELIPYKDSLYVWEVAAFDSLFSASLFLMLNDGNLSYVNSPKYPLETLHNNLLIPQACNRELKVNLKYIMYGKRNESMQLDYRKLFGVLSSGMKTGMLISPREEGSSQVMLVFWDSLTGVRHIVYGNIDPEAIVSGRIKTLNLKLISHIIGSAENTKYTPGKEPPWQVEMK